MEPAALLTKTALAQPGIAGKGLFLNAAPAPGLRDLPDITAHTVWRDVYSALERDGVALLSGASGGGALEHAGDSGGPDDRGALNDLNNLDDLGALPAGTFDYVLCAIPKNMAEAEGLLSHGLRVLRSGGVLMAAAANDAGGRRIPALFEKAGLAPEKISKARSTLCVARQTGDAALPDTGAFRSVLNDGFISRPGIFGWEDVDIGSAMLAQSLPAAGASGALSGTGADFGCGYGYLTRAALERGGDAVTRFYSIDADARAVAACRRNCPAAEALWLDLTAESLPRAAGALDFIVMNPPFHKGKSVDIGLGRAMTEKAAASLRRGGALWMVANAHLPYEDILSGLFRTADRLGQSHGYKIFRAVK